MLENAYVTSGLANKKLQQAAELVSEKIVQVHGHDFIILPNVFDPDIFPSAHFIAKPWVKLIQELKPLRVLEIGSAAGYHGILAALNGATFVTCTDIVGAAVENIRANIERFDLKDRVRAFQSDVFDALAETNDKYDLIFWNFPFGHINKPPGDLTDLERAIFDPGYVSIEKYLQQARHYLAPNGHVYIGFSPTIGYWDELIKITEKSNWQLVPYKPDETTVADKQGLDEVVAGQQFQIYKLLDRLTL